MSEAEWRAVTKALLRGVLAALDAGRTCEARDRLLDVLDLIEGWSSLAAHRG